jgi:hypothetical protein
MMWPVRPGRTGRKAVRGLVALVTCLAVAACGADPSPTPASASPVAAVPSATPVISPTARPTASPVPPTPDPAAFVATDWGRVAAPAFSDRVGSTGMAAVAASGDQVVAVGRGPIGAVVWTYGEDRVWRRAPDSPSFDDSRMDDVVALASGGFAAVGAHRGLPAAWASPDGATWTPATVEVPKPDPNGEGGSAMQHVTRGPGGLAAIGTGRDSGTGPAVWTSVDGLRWTIAVDPMAGISAGSDIGVTDDIGATPDGQFMIVGSANGEGDGAAAAWRSSDARKWIPVTEITGTWLRGFVPWRGGIVAVGSSSTEDLGLNVPVVWVMDPSGKWSQIQHVPGSTGADRDVSLVAITATADHLVATGPSPTGVVGVWISTDARKWTLIDSPGLAGPEGEFEPTDVADTNQGLVVVGDFPNEDPSSTWSASVWTDPAPGQPAGSKPVAVVHPCSPSAATLIDIAEMTPNERLACFGRRDLTLRGYLGGLGDGGMTAFPPTLGWLADDTSCCRPLLPLAGRPQDVVFLPVAFDPSGPRQAKIPDLAAIAVTGHFDDPRATKCREEGVSVARSVKACRARFVITSVKRIVHP